MKTTWRSRTALGLATAGLLTLGWTTTVYAAPTPTPTPTAAATADATLSTNLTHMRDEERLARDIYTALAARYSQAAPFVNIARSEQVHFDTMGLLLTRYGVADPSAGKNPGTYADPALQSLYDKLLASGSESLAEAYEVGISVENLDIADLKAAIGQTSQADVKAAFTNLMNGSSNHLAAFTAAKDGKILGARNGQGMQNGRSGANSAGQRGNGRGQGMGAGTGAGWGQPGTTRPTTCPLR
ncbi:MAG TPA: DUF2202 domain-containing protein [Propionicimonas sp.]|jgi:hypothetical protein